MRWALLALALSTVARAAPKSPSTTFKSRSFSVVAPGAWSERKQAAPSELPPALADMFASRKLFEATADGAQLVVTTLAAKEKLARPEFAAAVANVLAVQLAGISAVAGGNVVVDGPVLSERGDSFEGRARVVDDANRAVTYLAAVGLADRVVVAAYTSYARLPLGDSDGRAAAIALTVPPAEKTPLGGHGVPLGFSPAAVTALRMKAGRGGDEAVGVRVAVKPDGDGFRYLVDLEETIAPGDLLFVRGPLRVFVDPTSARYLQGATVDWSPVPAPGGFTLANPNASGESRNGAVRLKAAY